MNATQLKKTLYYYTFFNVFSVIVIVQNLSIYFFPFLVHGLFQRGHRMFFRVNFLDVLAVLLGVGIVMSVFSTLYSPIPGLFVNSITVLPNYLYWVFLIVFLPSYAKLLDYQKIYKAVFWGIIACVIYFYIFDDLIYSQFFKGLQQNTFSFILICFAPMLVYYTQEKHGKTWALLAAIGVVAAGAFSGSRSGSLLTILTCFATLYSNKITIPRLIIGLIAIFGIIPVMLSLPVVKDTIFNVNERTYNLVYLREEALEKDESFLIRVAQVEKGLSLFAQNPVTGIGINNFSLYDYQFKGDFEGWEVVQNIEELDKKSAHNSYIGMLAEGGLMVFIPFIAILVYLLGYFIINFKKMPDFQKPFFWGLIGMCIHLYFIMAIVNVFAWFLIAFAAAAVKYNKPGR